MAIEILGWDLNIGVGRVIRNTGIYFVGPNGEMSDDVSTLL